MRRIRKCISLSLMALIVLGLPLRAWDGEADRGEKKPAVVVVRLPADAELVIAGVTSKQKTEVREFDTPPLEPGKKFSYVLKAAWKDGEKEITHVRTIFVKSGETTEIDLLASKPAPPSVEKIPAPELMPAKETKPTSKPEPEKKPDAENKPEPEKKPELQPEPVKKLEPEKKPEIKPEPIKKPETQPEPEKKPELKPEPEKKPEPQPERIKMPKLKPKPESSFTPSKPVSETPTAQGTLSLLMPETLNLQPGGTKLFPIKVVRTHCEGPVSVTFEGLPSGVEVTNTTVAADKQKVYVKAAAPANAEEKEWEVKVIGVSGAVRQESALKIKIAK